MQTLTLVRVKSYVYYSTQGLLEILTITSQLVNEQLMHMK